MFEDQTLFHVREAVTHNPGVTDVRPRYPEQWGEGGQKSATGRYMYSGERQLDSGAVLDAPRTACRAARQP